MGYNTFSSISIRNLGFLCKILGGILIGKVDSTLGISSIFTLDGIDDVPSIRDDKDENDVPST